jgi:hypothetical protein
MKKIISSLSLVLLSLVIILQEPLAAEYPWKLRIKKDSISVYTRRVEGSPIFEFKADVIVDEPLEKVIHFFEDETKITQWYYQCVKAEVVRKNSPAETVFYFVINLAWPVTDRDCVFNQIKSVDPKSGTVIYTSCALPNDLPKQKGNIRVLFLNASWHFTPLKGGRTEIYFQQHSDPGGSIPSLLVNRLSVETPFHCLNNLRRMIGEIKD